MPLAGLEGGGKTDSIKRGPEELGRTASVRVPQGSPSELAGPSLGSCGAAASRGTTEQSVRVGLVAMESFEALPSSSALCPSVGALLDSRDRKSDSFISHRRTGRKWLSQELSSGLQSVLPSFLPSASTLEMLTKKQGTPYMN